MCETFDPVIVNASLQSKGVCRYLQQENQLKIRISCSTLEGTCIFPKSSVAFLILEEHEIRDKNGFNRIFPLKCYFNLVHSVKEATKMMIHVAKMHSGPIGECLQQKVVQLRETLESELTVKTVLKSLPLTGPVDVFYMLMEEPFLPKQRHFLLSIKSISEQTLVLDTCGTLSGLGSASENELLNSGLDSETAKNLVQFFNNDTYLLT